MATIKFIKYVADFLVVSTNNSNIYSTNDSTIDSVIYHANASLRAVLLIVLVPENDHPILYFLSVAPLTIRKRRKRKDWPESTRGSRKAHVTRRERDGERLPREARQPWGDPLSGSLIILECARTSKIYRGRMVAARRVEVAQTTNRKENERDGECRHCKPKLQSKINDFTLYYRHLWPKFENPRKSNLTFLGFTNERHCEACWDRLIFKLVFCSRTFLNN